MMRMPTVPGVFFQSAMTSATAGSSLGAIALYLNVGLMFSVLYRLTWYLIPHALTNILAM
jgi:hypothetical protein